jgi:hypothetical protein
VENSSVNDSDKSGISSVLTIGNVFDVLAPKTTPDQLLNWPPDAFAIASFLLQKSGAYIQIARSWPPGEFPESWVDEMHRIGAAWRDACINGQSAPSEIQAWWGDVISKFSRQVAAIPDDVQLIQNLVQIIAAADEACFGIGIPDSEMRVFDQFDNRAWRLLYRSGKASQSSLAEHIDPSLFRVLPKMHTPQSGITIRSLSHHLALCTAGEVNPKWVLHPPSSTEKEPSGLNILLVPWPKKVSPLDFRATVGQPGLRYMPPNMGFFAFEQKGSAEWPSAIFKDLVRRSLDEVGRIDGVVLPELALRSNDEFDRAFSDLVEIIPDAFLISGFGGKSAHPPYDVNELGYRVWLGGDRNLDFRHTQGKHHRWRLDESQIRQYGLTHRLDPYVSWWENTDVCERRVHFFAISPWLTMCALICEDLARQDPVADVLRAVGPNLIVALLMDGPQLQRRWSARYATVFADDPGSSVLCLTSAGMVGLSNENLPPAEKEEEEPKRIIGLWKDARGPARQIELKEDCEAVVLSLNREYCREWTADARDDHKTTAYLTFGRFHNIPEG